MVNQIVVSKMLNISISGISSSSPLSKKKQKLEVINENDEQMSSFINSTKPWILVANDDIFLLQMIEGTLEDDFQVEVAENGLQAYELVKKHGRAHYNAIVLDINMPIMDGIDACNKIHSYLSQEDLISNMKIERKLFKDLSCLKQSEKADVFSFKENLKIYRKSSSLDMLDIVAIKVAEILTIPAKIYALTGDTSPNAVIYINEKAPHFECIFDLMSIEAKQRILDDIAFASAH